MLDTIFETPDVIRRELQTLEQVVFGEGFTPLSAIEYALRNDYRVVLRSGQYGRPTHEIEFFKETENGTENYYEACMHYPHSRKETRKVTKTTKDDIRRYYCTHEETILDYEVKTKGYGKTLIRNECWTNL